jgi:hypothetical protein
VCSRRWVTPPFPAGSNRLVPNGRIASPVPGGARKRAASAARAHLRRRRATPSGARRPQLIQGCCSQPNRLDCSSCPGFPLMPAETHPARQLAVSLPRQLSPPACRGARFDIAEMASRGQGRHGSAKATRWAGIPTRQGRSTACSCPIGVENERGPLFTSGTRPTGPGRANF